MGAAARCMGAAAWCTHAEVHKGVLCGQCSVVNALWSMLCGPVLCGHALWSMLCGPMLCGPVLCGRAGLRIVAHAHVAS